VLHHLLTNAAMWTRQGSVHLSVTHDVYPNGAPRCVFNVTDTGVGIAGNIDVFAKYHQQQSMGKAPKGGSELSQIYLASVQQARDRQVEAAGSLSNAKGVGLGLLLSYNITNALGGELCFSSEPGNTKFSFSLPYLAASASTLAPEEAAARYDAIPTAGLTHMRITRKSAPCELCAYDKMNFDTITSSSSASSLTSLLSVGFEQIL